MGKIIMHISYNGKNFNGWEGSTNSVDCYLKSSIEQTLGYKEEINIVCAGRTDTGVHGLGQVIHFNLDTCRTCISLQLGTNYFLKKNNHDIWVLDCYRGNENFNSRFSAKNRVYRYYLTDQPLFLLRDFMIIVNNINWTRVQDGCQLMIGTYDISCFCPNKYSGRKLRTVDRVELKFEIMFGYKVYFIEVASRGFAHHQVRFMVGALLLVGRGVYSLTQLQQFIYQKRKLYLAPSRGLVLYQINY